MTQESQEKLSNEETTNDTLTEADKVFDDVMGNPSNPNHKIINARRK